ncbi:MAG TPA: AEC family transporter [Clostridiales bacterium]|nr:AEC family transporter [Clostridiales bacterium]
MFDSAAFLGNMKLAAEQVAILYIVVLIGIIADKLGVFTEKIARLCTGLLFYIITPAVIIRSFLQVEKTEETSRGLFIALGCGLLIHLVAALINIPFFRKGDPNKTGVLKFAAVFGNCGYMALPLANAILGSEGVLYSSAVIMAYQIFAFTLGVYFMSEKNEDGKSRFDYKKLVINPGTLSVAVGLPLFLLGVQLPRIAFDPIEYIAGMNTPLAMLIFGTYLASVDYKKFFSDGRIFVVALFKLIVLPAVMLVIFKLFGLAGNLIAALTISASAPTANNTVVFAAKYDRDTTFASQTIAIVSLLSIITMPFMIALASQL